MSILLSFGLGRGMTDTNFARMSTNFYREKAVEGYETERNKWLQKIILG